MVRSGLGYVDDLKLKDQCVGWGVGGPSNDAPAEYGCYTQKVG